MIPVYFIDRHNQLNNNGLNTYTHQLTTRLAQNPQLRLTIIWLECPQEAISKSVTGNISHLHVPHTINKALEHNGTHPSIAQVIINEIGNTPNAIIHLNWINHCVLGWHLKNATDAKIVLTCHCLPWRDLLAADYPTFYQLNKAYTRNQKTAIGHVLLRREMMSYDYIDHIITVTNSARRSLTGLYNIDSSKITVIPNGISPGELKRNTPVTRERLRKKYGFAPHEKIVLYVGKVTVLKGIIHVIRQFSRLAAKPSFKNVRLVIAGYGDYKEALQSITGRWTHITFTGNLCKGTLYDFYAMADIGLIPSFTEQCSYTAIEMMMSGLPVLAADIDGLQEMINTRNGLRLHIRFTPKGPLINGKELEQKINFLLHNTQAAAALATHARQQALQRYSALRMTSETVALYEQLLQPANGHTPYQLPTAHTLPLVTILLPCFNAGTYLPECLSSIFRQTYPHFELIIINDASADNTDTIIRQQTDTRIIHIENLENKGITATLNKGIQLAQGKYIARIDADDRMTPDRLERQVNFLEEHVAYGMTGAQHNIINAAGLPVNRICPLTDSNMLKLSLLFFNPFAHPAVTMRSSIAKDLLYDTAFGSCEDYELWFRIAESHKIHNLNLPLLDYRVHGQNHSIQQQKQMQENVMQLLSRELDKIEVSHSAEELALHMAIHLGYGARYFNAAEKMARLGNWLHKITGTSLLAQQYPAATLHKFKKYLVESRCGLPFNAITPYAHHLSHTSS
ncbi:glycosyltransferase involved in cell wall biosynthesis [Filimonas zeae]|uniref:Uncharacterized protein n=1 Tax=Filimonas zeae TaxID=1737353 RepID=A0A917MWM0_9BACT|nr:glycosyltransferase [Filimonas zeae]MDR6339103.1 glycosyltransferase involved in cell wall biosynthesis [Filimonas zeae]GGH65097.1 hypothetical protein GCM10011379_17870 [Filimonas zeae]